MDYYSYKYLHTELAGMEIEVYLRRPTLSNESHEEHRRVLSPRSLLALCSWTQGKFFSPKIAMKMFRNILSIMRSLLLVNFRMALESLNCILLFKV